MKTLRLKSPAKLNLYLKVNFKRPDGYHDLTTLFERISLCDELTFKPNASGKILIRTDHSSLPTGPKNLVYRVAKLLQDEFGVKQGVEVMIHKRTPVAAGLGGGSSNAATTLIGLNRIWNLALSRNQLLDLACRIGSDVPFFIYDCPWALGFDRGDKVIPLKLSMKLWHVLVIPKIKVFTKDVFKAFRLSLRTPAKKGDLGPTNLLTKQKGDVNILARALRKNDISAVEACLSNDLETAIARVHPRLLLIKENLSRYMAQGVCFSGSGPSIFGIFETPKEAESISNRLQKIYSQVYVVRTL